MREFDSDYYEILRIRHDADIEQIRSAFRKLAKEFHPDKSGKNAQEFVRLRKAYETLSNPRIREEYDRYLYLLAGNQSLIEIRPVVQDVYDDLVGYLKEIIGLSSDSEYELVLRRNYINEDKIVRLDIPVETLCHKCLGTGGSIIKDCPVCGGRGRHVHKESIDLFIEAGSRDGEEMLLTFPGQKVKLRLRFR